MRILLYTGKGGVGKTSISAATAYRCAELGYRTIVVSTDPAHSLGDSYDMRIGSEVTQLAPNLWGQEVDLLNQMDKYWGRVQNYLNALFSWQGMEGLLAEETSVLPGMEELASLMQITHLADSGDYDVVIIDAAPTGATLQLLSFPDMARWYMEKFFPLQRRTLQLARPMVKRFTDMPLPDDSLFESVEELVGYLARMSELLGDPQISSMRVVLNPERMVVKEAQRAYTYLNLYGYAVDSIFCNRVFPQHLTDHYFDEWKRAQANNMELVRAAFHPLPIFEIPFFEQEVTGLAMIEQMANAIYGVDPVRGAASDPTTHYYVGNPQTVLREENAYVLSIPLPLATRAEVQLHRSVIDELIIHIGNWKRNIALPTGLAKLEINEARFVDDRLNIYFEIPEEARATAPDVQLNGGAALRERLFGKKD